MYHILIIVIYNVKPRLDTLANASKKNLTDQKDQLF